MNGIDSQVGMFGEAGGASASYYDEVMADSPDVWWRLGESSGTTANDEIGSNDGTYINSVTFGGSGVSGDGNTSVLFPGSGTQRVDCGSIGNYTSSDFSIEFWINAVSFASNQDAGGCIAIFRGQFQQHGYYLYLSTGGAASFQTNQSGAIQSTSTSSGEFSSGAWVHVVITRSGADVKIYINGVDKTASTGSHVDPDSSPDQFVINDYNSNSWSANASYDEVAIYSTCLSAARVSAHYAAATP